MTRNESELRDIEKSNLNALKIGEERTIADLERTIIVATRVIVDTLYRVRN